MAWSLLYHSLSCSHWDVANWFLIADFTPDESVWSSCYNSCDSDPSLSATMTMKRGNWLLLIGYRFVGLFCFTRICWDRPRWTFMAFQMNVVTRVWHFLSGVNSISWSVWLSFALFHVCLLSNRHLRNSKHLRSLYLAFQLNFQLCCSDKYSRCEKRALCSVLLEAITPKHDLNGYVGHLSSSNLLSASFEAPFDVGQPWL